MNSPPVSVGSAGRVAEAGDTTPAAASFGGFTRRLLSILVLLPAVLALTWAGGLFFVFLCAIALLLLAAEWRRITGGDDSGTLFAFTILATLFGLLLTVDNQPVAALAFLFISSAVAAPVARWQGGRARWAVLAPLYFGLPVVALAWVRLDVEDGRIMILTLLAIVWASDIGAYLFGSMIGGIRLAPRISPNKTWAGALGGLILAAIVGFLGARLPGMPVAWVSALLAVFLAAWSQVGDLAESALKRNFGVKDSGALIPGHGGLLDRVDSLLFAAPLGALIVALYGGAV